MMEMRTPLPITSREIVKKSFLELSLKKIQSNNEQNEIYLTDIVEIANLHDNKVGLMMCDDHKEVKGVNTIEELNDVQAIMAGD